jgi:ATP-binding cassette, subfamily B, bacterial
MDTIKRFNSIMYQNRAMFLISMIAVALTTFFSMLLPLVVKFLIDVVLGYSVYDDVYFIGINIAEESIQYLRNNLWIFFVLVVTLALIEGVFSFLGGLYASKASEGVAKNLRDKLFLHIQKLPFSYYSTMQTGDLIQRSTSDVENIRRFFENQAKDMARSILIIVFSFIILININVTLTLVAFITTPFLFIGAYFFFVKINGIFEMVEFKNSEKTTVFEENLTAVRVIRAFGNQNYETKRFNKKNSEYENLHTKYMRYHALFWSITNFLCFIQIGVVLFYGSYMIYLNQLTLGALVVFYTYTNMIIWPIRNVSQSLVEVGTAKISIKRIDEILEVKSEDDIKGSTKSMQGDIVFKNVCFGYDEGKMVLNNINMTIKNGETVGIIGSTGSGKSTLAQLLIRLFEYTEGSITVNGEELKNIDKTWVRSKISIVLQQPFLFSRTIKDNILMAKEGATNEEVEKCAKDADIHKTIVEFKDGYETMGGENGVTFSGGQKQRVSIARSLLKDSDILIFDDSLSAVDTQTEANIRKAIKNATNKKTTIIISSRVNTIKDADKIFVIEDGKITNCGTHSELIALDGFYSKVWKIQSNLKNKGEEEGLNGYA